MGFEVEGGAYDRFMGRYSEPLAGAFVEFIGVGQGQSALDVGCGTGALTGRLVKLLGADAVHGVDPSASFVDTCRRRLPGVDVREAVAESLPFDDDAFDVVAASLVVHFMTDPAVGATEMARVARPGGTVAACVWDLYGGRGPISPLWAAARDLDPDVHGEADLPGVRAGALAEVLARGGVDGLETTELSVTVAHRDFDDWWEPYTFGVGPAGAYVAGLDRRRRDRLRDRCAELFPGSGPFEVTAVAWAVRGRV